MTDKTKDKILNWILAISIIGMCIGALMQIAAVIFGGVTK